jgi:hypothetical protein
MRSYKKLLIFAALVLLHCPMPVAAIPVPALNLFQLTAKSDVIVVAQVIGVREEGQTTMQAHGQSFSARQMLATLRISRIVKGQPRTETVSFKFLRPEAGLGYAGIGETQFGMFFLRETAQSGYEIMNPYYPFIVASSDAPVLEGRTFERVVAEVTQVLGSVKTSPDDIMSAISVLEQVKTPFVSKALKDAAQRLHGPLSLHAISVLLRRNETSVLDLAERALLSPPQNTEVRLRRMLAYAIRDGVTDPDAIPALIRLLRAEEVETRRSAAAALRHVGTEDVIEPLALGLQDADHEVRYQAVLGLAAVTGQSDWAPSVDLFAKDEQRFVMYWRDWLKVR